MVVFGFDFFGVDFRVVDEDVRLLFGVGFCFL